MRYLTRDEVLELHRLCLEQSGGSEGVRDLGLLESAVAQPSATFGGHDLYPTVADKAVALGFSLIMNHAFVDGNKRVGHAALEVFLVLNGHELVASTGHQEAVILGVAGGTIGRDEFSNWVKQHVIEW